MNCSNKIYKGESLVVIPFDIEGWSALHVDYFTDGKEKVTVNSDALEISGGVITAHFAPHDLDLLADGVLRYTIYYTIDDTNYTISTNSPYILKTPMGYNAETKEIIWNEGFASGETVGYAEGFEDGWDSAHTYDYTIRITYPMRKEGSYQLWGMFGMTEPFYINGVERTYTFEFNPWIEPGNNNIFIETNYGDGSPIISIDMEPYFLNAPIPGGNRYPTPDEMVITIGGVSMVVTAWTMGEYTGGPERYYQPYHIECEPLSLDPFESGFLKGFSSGYTAGQADCPECSGSTSGDCSAAVAAAYQDGYNSGVSATYYLNAARNYYIHGSITFAQDTTLDNNFNIHVFLMNDSETHEVLEDFIQINYESLYNLKYQGATMSAGRYDFNVYLNIEVTDSNMSDFYIAGPICDASGVSINSDIYFYIGVA